VSVGSAIEVPVSAGAVSCGAVFAGGASDDAVVEVAGALEAGAAAGRQFWFAAVFPLSAKALP
jgi:hypothetical protein